MKKKLDDCYHCKLGRERKLHKGVHYHTYKESNGMDYDSYVSLCAVQTSHGIETLRARAMATLDKKLAAAKEQVKKLKAEIKYISAANTAGSFRQYWE